MKRYITEFIGTFFLVLVIGLTGDPLAIGGALAALVYMGAFVSGAHYNPAVTLAIWMQKKIKAKEAGFYVASQLLGAIAAAAIYNVIYGDIMVVRPDAEYSFAVTFLVEMLFTFALVSIVLHTAVAKKAQGNNYYGLAIGAIVMAGALAVGHISGGAFNPAVGLGPNLYDLNALSTGISDLALYILGPVAGGLAASLAFSLTAQE